uniref:Uncharacterized protein n=1 Tax=Moniliophthora roreri TaxID=221103 RepID=A0A0W0GBQ2_MONRR
MISKLYTSNSTPYTSTFVIIIIISHNLEMSFTNSSQVSIRGRNTFNHVHGNQVNQSISAEIVNMINEAEVERTEFDEFEYVKRGNVISVKKLDHTGGDGQEWTRTVRRSNAWATAHTVELHPTRQRFTAFMYEGEDPHELWEKDFQLYSHDKDPETFQLFGLNRSQVPMLIFHNEWTPLAHIYTTSFWKDMFIHFLAEHADNSRSSLWMDGEGILRIGPHGPFNLDWRPFDSNANIIVPSTADMLKDDTCLRFFSKQPSSSGVDESILRCARWSHKKDTYLDDLFSESETTCMQDHRRKDDVHAGSSYIWRSTPYLPSILNTVTELRFDTIYSSAVGAVARWKEKAHSWWILQPNGLLDPTWLDSGLTRFKLDTSGEKEVEVNARFDWMTFETGWLSQSTAVFNHFEKTINKESFFIAAPPAMQLRSTSSRIREIDNATELCDPVQAIPPGQAVYLFLHPFPMAISELISWMNGRTHFWSFDETGQFAMSAEESEQWGLPKLTPCIPQRPPWNSVTLSSWPSYVYTALCDWQTARGFDPTTPDFARHMGFPEFEIISVKKDQNEFEEEEEKSSGSWWEAIVGSNISAFGF